MKVNRVLTLRPELLKMNVSDADVPEQRVLVQEPVTLTDEEIEAHRYHLYAQVEYEAYTNREQLFVLGVAEFARAVIAAYQKKQGEQA